MDRASDSDSGDCGFDSRRAGIPKSLWYCGIEGFCFGRGGVDFWPTPPQLHHSLKISKNSVQVGSPCSQTAFVSTFVSLTWVYLSVTSVLWCPINSETIAIGIPLIWQIVPKVWRRLCGLFLSINSLPVLRRCLFNLSKKQSYLLRKPSLET